MSLGHYAKSYATSLFLPADLMFISDPMMRRQERLVEARKNADRCQRELRRDRTDLERKERALLVEIKTLLQRGDKAKAKLLANQAAMYRAAARRNLCSAVTATTRAQLMLSDHKVSRAEVEAIKGVGYGNLDETVESTKYRVEKYSSRMSDYELMEELLHEGLDDIFVDLDHQWTTAHAAPKSKEKLKNPKSDFDNEVDEILESISDQIELQKRQTKMYSGHSESLSQLPSAPNFKIAEKSGKNNGRKSSINTQQNPRPSDASETLKGTPISPTVVKSALPPVVMILNVRLFKPSKISERNNVLMDGVTVYIRKARSQDSNEDINVIDEITCDDLKREITADMFAVSQLQLMNQLGHIKAFNIGWLDSRKEFHALLSHEKIANHGIRNSDTVYLLTL